MKTRAVVVRNIVRETAERHYNDRQRLHWSDNQYKDIKNGLILGSGGALFRRFASELQLRKMGVDPAAANEFVVRA
ncbi:MAG: hypothetical protein ABUL43_03050, partial [Hyphomicrobium sp.]